MNVTLTVGGDFNNRSGSFLSNTHQVEQTDPPDPLPPKPGLFLGRDNLLYDITTKLGNNRHVALVGPGGIGKTSIAKVVPHDSSIIENFGDQCFYVRFDGIDFSQATHHIFFERMAKALGVKGSEKHPDVLVRKYLVDSSKKKFLVLDNVETFLHASDPAITPAIAELAEMESVTFLLTTRTRDIPITSRLETIEVPPLDEEAAYAMFAKIYNDTGHCPSVVKALISTLQFHPLSIILLAQVAKKNQWTPTELVANWEEHQIRLLSGGGGENNILKITIELSLKSPSILNLTGNARHFLSALAFLPQGVDKKKLKDLFPTVVAVNLLADTLRSHSLLYLEGERFTMLAPIRLYLTAEDEADSPLLTDVKAYYYGQLKCLGDVGDEEKSDEEEEEASTWIKLEDINVERMIARDLGVHENIRTKIVKELPKPSFVKEFKDNLNNYVRDSNLKMFFAPNDPFLQKLAAKAFALHEDDTTDLSKPENIKRLARLSLYRLVIFCDDSGSMKHDDRFLNQLALVNRIARVATRIVPDDYKGVDLRFINSPGSDQLDGRALVQAIKAVKPKGGTPIGTNLRSKILEPLVYNALSAGTFKRPLFVCIITDGSPSGEEPDVFKKAILECKVKLVEAGYNGACVKFLISQIGDDEFATDFLESLRTERKLEKVLHCTADRLEDKFRELKEKERSMERWLIEMLTKPFMEA